MQKYYVRRYMNINKCEEIKRTSTCEDCGSELEGHHVTDFNDLSVQEFTRCPQCQSEPSLTEHSLH